jgi:hypothetical protein
MYKGCKVSFVRSLLFVLSLCADVEHQCIVMAAPWALTTALTTSRRVVWFLLLVGLDASSFDTGCCKLGHILYGSPPLKTFSRDCVFTVLSSRLGCARYGTGVLLQCYTCWYLSRFFKAPNNGFKGSCFDVSCMFIMSALTCLFGSCRVACRHGPLLSHRTGRAAMLGLLAWLFMIIFCGTCSV